MRLLLPNVLLAELFLRETKRARVFFEFFDFLNFFPSFFLSLLLKTRMRVLKQLFIIIRVL